MNRAQFMARIQKEILEATDIDDADAPALPHLRELVEDAQAYRLLTTPEVHDFLTGVTREAIYQRRRWASNGDAGKTDADWLWLLGYLATKAMLNPHKENTHSTDARAHRIITVAAAALNWHAATLGLYGLMAPGLAQEPTPQLLLDI